MDISHSINLYSSHVFHEK
ncbi:hypothetical protein [Neisseria sp. MVDL18-041461]